MKDKYWKKFLYRLKTGVSLDKILGLSYSMIYLEDGSVVPADKSGYQLTSRRGS